MDNHPGEADTSVDRRHLADQAIKRSLKPAVDQRPAHIQIPRWAGPICGAIAGLFIANWMPLFGGERSWLTTGLSILFGAIAGGLIWLMEIIEQAGNTTTPRKPAITVLVLLVGTATFWVPLLGLAILSYGLYRARWLKINDWFMVPFTFLWFLSVGITIVMGMIYAMD